MKLENYLNTDGVEMVLVIDGDKAESMTKAEYDRREAEQSTPSVIDAVPTK
jgi:hypothetical protein